MTYGSTRLTASLTTEQFKNFYMYRPEGATKVASRRIDPLRHVKMT